MKGKQYRLLAWNGEVHRLFYYIRFDHKGDVIHGHPGEFDSHVTLHPPNNRFPTPVTHNHGYGGRDVQPGSIVHALKDWSQGMFLSVPTHMTDSYSVVTTSRGPMDLVYDVRGPASTMTCTFFFVAAGNDQAVQTVSRHFGLLRSTVLKDTEPWVVVCADRELVSG